MSKKSFQSGTGPSTRQLRVGELIRRTLAGILAQGDVHDPDLNRMSITVGEVRTSPDLRVATIFVLPLGGGSREAAIEALNRNRGELRHQIDRKLSLKRSPALHFVVDETFDRMDETRRMLDSDAVRRDIGSDGDAGDDAAFGDESGGNTGDERQ